LNFFTSYSSLAYIYSGAFLDFLYKEYGVTKVKKLYKNSDWTKIFGEDLQKLLTRFVHTLESDTLHYDSNQARLFFGGQTIFKKFCPRMASNDLRNAKDLIAAKKYNEAEKLYRNVYQYSNAASALSGIVISMNMQKEHSAAINLLQTEKNKFSNDQYYYNLEFQLADTHVQTGDVKSAMIQYDSIIYHSPGIIYTNEAKIRKMLLQDEGTDSLIMYLKLKSDRRLANLLKQNQKELKTYSLPYIVNSALFNKYDLSEWLEKHAKNFNVSDYESNYAAISISRYYLEKRDYRHAKIFAVKALDYKTDIYKSYTSVENLRLVNWFYSFAEETKSSFQYR
jgi:hypothetical protein